MRHLVLAAILPLATGASAQATPILKLAVRSCARADSILGPLRPGKAPEITALAPAPGQLLIHVTNAGSPSITTIVPATTAPALEPVAVLHLYLTGDAARDAVLQRFPTILSLFIDKDPAISLSADTVQAFLAAGPAAILNLRAELTPTVVAKVVAARDAWVTFDSTKAHLQRPFRNGLTDAYRLTLCGYASP